jgi:hypothetical protein
MDEDEKRPHPSSPNPFSPLHPRWKRGKEEANPVQNWLEDERSIEQLKTYLWLRLISSLTHSRSGEKYQLTPRRAG